MRIFDFLYNKPRAVKKRSVTGVAKIWGDLPGEVSSPTMAMKISAVYRAVEIVSSSVASLGIKVLRRRNGDYGQYYKNDENSTLHYLLNVRPSQRFTAYEMWKNAVADILLRGNAYIVPTYGIKDIVSLTLLSPDSCTYEPLSDTYTVQDDINGIYGTFASDEIIHLRNVSIDGGYTGLSTLFFASKVLGIAAETDDQQKEMFEPGATLRGFISGEKSVTEGLGALQDDQLSDASEQVQNEINSGKRIFSLPGMMKFNQLQLTPADLKILESKVLNLREIARFFGCPPDKLFEQNSTNYAASQNSQTVFLSDTLQPMLAKIENELNVKLLTRNESRRTQIKFSFDDYFKSDLDSKANYYQKMIANGIYTVNDCRLMEGREPVEGGDKALVTCNVAPVEQATASEPSKEGK